ncbi:MAG: GerMN domain-containing protein [Ilumatobacteraceae bacterium]
MNRLAVMAVAAMIVAASCSTSGNGELEQIDSADLFGLDETSTSTTTTTPTTVPTTVTPTSSVEDTSGTTTTTTVATEQVDLYFVDGTQLAPVPVNLVRGPSPSRVVAALLAGPQGGPAGVGLRSKLPEDLVNTVVESGTGFVTVDMVGDAFQRIDPLDQRVAIGQLVLTLTERPGVGQVRFTLDGVGLRVPRLDGLQSEPGEAVSRQDYMALLDVAEPETTVITDAPTPTEPPAVPGT